jgi:hypothetical protein
MGSPDQQFRLGVLGGGFVLVAIVGYLRFCGSVSLPAKPPPRGPVGTERELLTKSGGSQSIYQSYLSRDAAAAGVDVPTIADMSRKLAYHVEASRHVLEVGAPPVELAGLQLHVEHSGAAIVLVMKDLLPSDVAYEVTTLPTGVGADACEGEPPLPFNGMVIARGTSETRVECGWHDGMAIAVTKVETIEVPALSSWYLSQLPPAAVGIEPRIARGHHGVVTRDPCTPVLPQVVRAGLDDGQITWRDLVDFYARHRCQTYQFPASYRAFTSDGERPLPAADASM